MLVAIPGGSEYEARDSRAVAGLPVSRNMPRCAENAYSLSGTLCFWSAAPVEAIHTPCVLACVSAEPGAGGAAGPSSP